MRALTKGIGGFFAVTSHSVQIETLGSQAVLSSEARYFVRGDGRGKLIGSLCVEVKL